MHKFGEDLLQFIWQHRLLKPAPLITRSGKELFILDPGERNSDAGPDFFNARIRLNDLLLAGNIEVHLKTSDWLKHRHQQDRSYDILVLHVVYEHDLELEQNTAHNVEVLELKHLVDESTLAVYRQMHLDKSGLPCAGQMKRVTDRVLSDWVERMTRQRLREKVGRMGELFSACGGDYTQTFYTCLLQSFGLKVNALPFGLIAKQLPLSLLLKHSDHLLRLEALLLGISGQLDGQFKDAYMQQLGDEFRFLKDKYGLQPLRKELFKFSKLRPANFPTLRLVQFATLVHRNRSLLECPQNWLDYNDLMNALGSGPEGYWNRRYRPDGREQPECTRPGTGSRENSIINAVVPFFIFYAGKLEKPAYAHAAMELLRACRVELNTKTRYFTGRKAVFTSAAASQGMIHLYDRYCRAKACLKCGIGVELLKPVQVTT